MSESKETSKRREAHRKEASDDGLRMFLVDMTVSVQAMVLAEDEAEAKRVAKDNFHDSLHQEGGGDDDDVNHWF